MGVHIKLLIEIFFLAPFTNMGVHIKLLKISLQSTITQEHRQLSHQTTTRTVVGMVASQRGMPTLTSRFDHNFCDCDESFIDPYVNPAE